MSDILQRVKKRVECAEERQLGGKVELEGEIE